MKKFIIIIILFIGTLVIIGGIILCSNADMSNYKLPWKDRAFAEITGDFLNKDPSDISDDDLEQIVKIVFSDYDAEFFTKESYPFSENSGISKKAIKSWDDLKLFTSLKTIAISNDILKLPPLQSLPIQVDVELEHALGIEQMQALKGVSNIVKLAIDSESINSMVTKQFLLHLPKLKDLTIYSLTDLSCLHGLTQLECLDFQLRPKQVNYEMDLTFLADIKGLKQLDIRSNSVKPLSLAPLSKLHNMERLYIDVEFLPSLAGIENMKKLKQITVTTSLLEDINALSSLDSLEYIDLGGNLINDISPLESLRQLEYLNLSSNEINDYTPLSGLPNLKIFYVGGQASMSREMMLTVIPTLPSLEWFYTPLKDDSDRNWFDQTFLSVNYGNKEKEANARRLVEENNSRNK